MKKKKYTITPVYKIGLVIIVLCLIILPIEIFLRQKYAAYESNTYQYTIDNFHPFLQSKLARQEGLPVNSLGFRGEEITKEKPEGTYRIVILGGSTVLNREVEFEKNAARLFEKKLRKQFPEKRIEVINAGKDYYTSEHSLIQYLFNIQDLNPDLVIMWHGINDMVASCTNEGVYSHGNYKSDYSHNLGAVAQIAFNYFRPQPVIQLKLVTGDFLLKAVQSNLYSDLTTKIKEKTREQAAIDFKENKNTITVHDYPSLSAYERNLSDLILFTREQGIPLVLGSQANLYKKEYSIEEVERLMSPVLVCQKDGKYYNLASLQYGLDQFNSKTETIAQDNDIPFINLEKAVPKNLNYFLDNVHYTEKGNEKVANALYEFILSHDIITQE